MDRRQNESGFTLVELVAVMAAALAMSAITVPRINAYLRVQRATTAARLVERELQTARLKAVTVSRSLRVRFNCPGVGQLRILELTGVTATDTAANRCDPVTFPSPGPSDGLRSTPSFDSPVVTLPSGASVTGTTLQFEFSPSGATYAVASNGTVSSLDVDATLTVTRDGYSRTVTINELGRVRLN
jgi:Tfp pilus assembly protein FimT